MALPTKEYMGWIMRWFVITSQRMFHKCSMQGVVHVSLTPQNVKHQSFVIQASILHSLLRKWRPRTINNRRAIVVLHRTHKNSNMVVTSHDGPLQNTTILELFISQSVPATKWAEQPRGQLPKDLQPAFNTQPFLWEQLPCLRPESTLQQCC